MATGALTDQQQKAAKIAGWAGLLMWPFVIYANFAVHGRLIIEGDAAETARNILAHEELYRIGIACDLIYSAGLVVFLGALYVILRPVGKNLALVAAFSRFLYALTWIQTTANLFEALRFLRGADYLRIFDVERLQALARAYIGSAFDQYYIGLLFWGLAAALCSYLWLRSRYIPTFWALFGLVSSLWGVVCTLIFIVHPGFATSVNLWWFDSPMSLFEIGTCLWLLARGLRPPSGSTSLSISS